MLKWCVCRWPISALSANSKPFGQQPRLSQWSSSWPCPKSFVSPTAATRNHSREKIAPPEKGQQVIPRQEEGGRAQWGLGADLQSPVWTQEEKQTPAPPARSLSLWLLCLCLSWRSSPVAHGLPEVHGENSEAHGIRCKQLHFAIPSLTRRLSISFHSQATSCCCISRSCDHGFPKDPLCSDAQIFSCPTVLPESSEISYMLATASYSYRYICQLVP